MEKVKDVLKNLNLLDNIYNVFTEHNIEVNDNNLKSGGFGFHAITESLPATVLLVDNTEHFVDKIKTLQETENLEQPFILLGSLQQDIEGNPLIIFDKFIGNESASKSKYSARLSSKMLKELNIFLNDKTISNKVILFGHTHPIVNHMDEDMSLEKNNAYKVLSNMEGNPLKLREFGMNISMGDVIQLVNYKELLQQKATVLQGIVLANGEFNIIFFDGKTLKSLDNIYQINFDNTIISRQNFRDDPSFNISKK